MLASERCRGGQHEERGGMMGGVIFTYSLHCLLLIEALVRHRGKNSKEVSSFASRQLKNEANSCCCRRLIKEPSIESQDVWAVHLLLLDVLMNLNLLLDGS